MKTCSSSGENQVILQSASLLGQCVGHEHHRSLYVILSCIQIEQIEGTGCGKFPALGRSHSCKLCCHISHFMVASCRCKEQLMLSRCGVVCVSGYLSVESLTPPLSRPGISQAERAPKGEQFCQQNMCSNLSKC